MAARSFESSKWIKVTYFYFFLAPSFNSFARFFTIGTRKTVHKTFVSVVARRSQSSLSRGGWRASSAKTSCMKSLSTQENSWPLVDGLRNVSVLQNRFGVQSYSERTVDRCPLVRSSLENFQGM